MNEPPRCWRDVVREMNPPDVSLVCAECGARFPMPGPIYVGSVRHLDQSGEHEVSYRY